MATQTLRGMNLSSFFGVTLILRSIANHKIQAETMVKTNRIVVNGENTMIFICI